jgi:hypothetical protein
MSREMFRPIDANRKLSIPDVGDRSTIHAIRPENGEISMGRITRELSIVRWGVSVRVVIHAKQVPNNVEIPATIAPSTNVFLTASRLGIEVYAL